MKVLIQYTQNPPQDWIDADLQTTGQASNRWKNSPKLARPTGGEVVGTAQGWVFDAAVMGIWLGGMDVYAVEVIGTGQDFFMRTTCWNDDPVQYPVGTRWARVMDFYNLSPWRIDKTYYTEPDASVNMLGPHSISSPGGFVTQAVYRPWSEFVPPAENVRRYGIQISDELTAAHVAARRIPAYFEWTG